MEKLKPCPFCGGESSYLDHRFYGLDNTYGIECVKCKAQSYQFFNSRAAAADAWNRRANDEH